MFFWNSLAFSMIHRMLYMKLKRCLLLGIKAMTILDSILKSRDIILLTKVCIVKPMVFPVVTYGCESWTIYDGWAPKHWSFWIVVLEKTLESPLNCKEIKPVKLKGNQPWIIIGRTDSEVKLQYFGHLMWRVGSLEKTLMMEKTESRRRRGNTWWDGWMASSIQWTWVWANSRR